MMQQETDYEMKIEFLEYDNVYIAHQIQVVTFGVIFAIFAVFMRYTFFNTGKTPDPEVNKDKDGKEQDPTNWFKCPYNP